MNWFRVLRARLFALGRKTEQQREMDEEIRFHLAMRTQENLRRGMPASEAASAAQRQFGNINLIKDAWRDVIGLGLLETLWQDERFAVRVLRKDHTFSVVAVLVLALSIGTNTALFTLADSVVLRPLPFANPERIMAIWSGATARPAAKSTVSYLDLLDFQSRNRSFESIGAFYSTGFVIAGGGGNPHHIQGANVTANLFSLLGVSPVAGRMFNAEEDALGNVAIISDELWQARFNRHAALDELSLTIDGIDCRIVGVMPPGFRFPVQNEPAQLWITFSRHQHPYPDGGPPPTAVRYARYLEVIGRLKQQVTVAEAKADLDAIAARLATAFPQSNQHFDSTVVMPLLDDITMDIRPTLSLLTGAGLCVLALGCVNVANLLLTRSSVRQKELAIRRALGAGRGRILRQLLTESLVLAVLGGLVGLVLGFAAIRGLVPVLPATFPRAAEIAPSLRAAGFTALVALVSSCLFGLAPAWGSSHRALAPILNESSRAAAATRKARRLYSTFAVVEMVLAFVLLVAAFLLFRNLARLQATPLGFDPRHVLTGDLSLPQSGDSAAYDRSAAFYEELRVRISRLKDVQSAAAISSPPLLPQAFTSLEVLGHDPAQNTLPPVNFIIVTPGYFRTLQIGILRGREFDERDGRSASGSVMINETLARNVFRGEDPLGRRIRLGVSVDALHGPKEREIIGVVADVKTRNLTGAPVPAVYLPHSQCATLDMTLVVRSNARPNDVFDSLRRVVAEMDASLPLFRCRAMNDNVAALVAQPRLNSILVSAFAAIGVLLSAIGLYGVISYSVMQRTHEIGIRFALGAHKPAIYRLVIGQAARLVAWSLVGGTLGGFLAARLLGRVVYGGVGGAPAAVVLVGCLLAVIAMLASWLPARRAAAVDPLRAIGQR